MLDRHREVLDDSPDRVDRQPLAEEVAGFGDRRFDRMAERVDPGVRGQLRGHRGRAIRGSVTEISGTSARPPIVTLRCRVVSVTTQNCDTSEPEPPVVGTITIGGIGLVARSMPS